MNAPIDHSVQYSRVASKASISRSGPRQKYAGLLIAVGLAGLIAVSVPATAQVLGTASNFAVLGGTPSVANTGPTVVSGSVGVFPALAITGFPPGLIAPGTGSLHFGDPVAQQAQADNTAAFGVLTALASVAIPAQLGGQVLGPGVYRPAVGDFDLTGVLTLTVPGLYVFQTTAGLVTSSGGTSIVNVGGASPCDIWWTVPSSASIGTGSVMSGNILALTSITIGTGASLTGRALAQTAAVTLASNAITACAGGSTPGFIVPALPVVIGPQNAMGGPTLSEWAMILLAGLLAIAGAGALRRK